MNIDSALKIQEWVDAANELNAARDKESQLRKEIFGEHFPDPKEGTNTVNLDNGWKLKAVHKLNRTLDKAALPAVLKEMEEGSEERLINYKPELKLKEYKALAEAQKQILNQAVTTKPGTPSLELVPPKETK